jgi:AcrR family transcriptional regulator
MTIHQISKERYSARKMPVQERSRETVRRIIDAATMILEERGYDGVSTNRIAAAAGISPGSLYQYFPNKDAILKSMVAEYTKQLMDRISTNMRDGLKCRPADIVSTAVMAQLDALLERPEILRVICGQLPGYADADVRRPLEDMISELVRGYAVALPDTPSDMDIDAATWIIVQLLGTSIRYVVDEPNIAKDVFVTEMAHLALRHPIAKRCTRIDATWRWAQVVATA